MGGKKDLLDYLSVARVRVYVLVGKIVGEDEWLVGWFI